jgi:hypothetical protein
MKAESGAIMIGWNVNEMKMNVTTERRNNMVKIHGKDYLTVAERLVQFHQDHPKGSIVSELISNVGGVSVMKATVTFDDRTFTGHASEKEGSSMINSTSALENAETSSWGRALAAAGYAGSEIASADEVANAIKQQEEPKLKHTHYVVPNNIAVNPAPSIALTVAQSLMKKSGEVFNLMAIVHDTNERSYTKNGKTEPITDYKVSDANSETKSIISRFGATHEGLKSGDVVLFKNVKVGSYQGNLTYLASSLEKISKEESPF